MKCIHCKHDANYKERSGSRCPKCQHRFAFEPRTGDPMTDAAFAAAIERVSSGSSVRFNNDHLYYEVRRRYLRRSYWGSATAFLFAAIVLCFIVGSGWLLLIVLGAIGGAYAWIWRRGTAPWRSFSRADFDRLWQRYLQVHGSPSGLIERRTRQAAPNLDPNEMLAYSFDRAVICDRAETVDLLIANQFHFENNCAVLSIDGYPPHAFETVRTMLRNNPRLVVLALHDASTAGCRLAHRLANDPAWFKDGVPVLDVGLRPKHRLAFRGQQESLQSAREVTAGDGIRPDEARWLNRNMLALAVVIPEQIIKRLFRAIGLAEEREDTSSGGDSGSGGGSDSGLEFELDADLGDGGGDSFG
jgi:DNA-directed RNA polymerase subunit RPC12/RpoP